MKKEYVITEAGFDHHKLKIPCADWHVDDPFIIRIRRQPVIIIIQPPHQSAIGPSVPVPGVVRQGGSPRPINQPT